MATYIGKVTVEVGVSVQARNQQEANLIVTERVFARIGDNLDDKVQQRSYEKSCDLRLLET
jgi:hypothetical protein